MQTIERSPVFAGQFYPGNRAEVLDEISFLGSQAGSSPSRKQMFQYDGTRGLIVPHAGWHYSGKTALEAFLILGKVKPQKIALLGPAHAYPLHGIAAESHDLWAKPLGSVTILHDDHFPVHDASHREEHSLEVQMPFIKHFAGDAGVLPLVVGRISDQMADDYASRLLEPGYFLVIRTDLSQFHPLGKAVELDGRSIRQIENLDHHGVDACGINPLRVAFAYCRKTGTKPRLIDYTTSASHSGRQSSVVGYASFYF